MRSKLSINLFTFNICFDHSLSKAPPLFALQGLPDSPFFLWVGFGSIVDGYEVIIPLSNAKAHECLHQAYDKYTGQWHETRPPFPIATRASMLIGDKPMLVRIWRKFDRYISSCLFFATIGRIT